MKTVNERSQFDAVQKRLQLLQNFLHTVISSEDNLLQQATEEYALTLQHEALRSAA